MDDDLAAIRDGWTAPDRDSEAVRDLADAYVAAHADDYAGFGNLDQDVLVSQLESYRTKGDEAGVWKVQAWLFHHFEPQNIGGQYQATVRVVS